MPYSLSSVSGVVPNFLNKLTWKASLLCKVCFMRWDQEAPWEEGSIINHLIIMTSSALEGKCKEMQELIPLGVFWVTWEVWNHRTLKEGVRSCLKMRDFLDLVLWHVSLRLTNPNFDDSIRKFNESNPFIVQVRCSSHSLLIQEDDVLYEEDLEDLFYFVCKIGESPINEDG